MGTIQYREEQLNNVKQNIVLFIGKKLKKAEKRKKYSCLVAVKNRMRNCNLRVRLGVRKTSSIYV